MYKASFQIGKRLGIYFSHTCETEWEQQCENTVMYTYRKSPNTEKLYIIFDN